MKRTFGVALLVALLVPVAALASKSAPRTAKATKVVVAVSSDYAALKQAKAKGVFSDAGLDVTFVAMGSAKGVDQAVIGGVAQFGITDPTVAMWQAMARDLSLQIVSGATAYKAKSIVAVAGSGVNTVADLNQATIAVPERGGVTFLATAVWLDDAGADSSSVVWKRVRVPQLGQALAGGAGAAVGPAALLKGKVLGDPIAVAFGAGAPLSVSISGTDVNDATIKQFVAALAGVDGFTTKLNMDALQAEAETIGNYGLTENDPDLATLVWAGAPKA